MSTPTPPKPTISFMYLNHRGKTALRTIEFESLEFITGPGFGYQPGWYVSGRCLDKDARRSFALSRIIFGDGQRTYSLLKL